MLPAPHQVRRSGLQRTRVELGRLQQGEGVLARGQGHPVRLGERRVRVFGAGRAQHAPYGCVVEPFQTAQDEGGAAGAAERGQPLVQGQFVGAARAREEPQAPHLGEQRRQLGAPRPGPAPQRAARVERGAQDPQPDEAVARIAVAPLGGAGRGDGRGIGRGTRARQGALGQGVRREYPAVAAEAGREHQIGEPDEPRVVLDESGLGLLHVDDRTGTGDDIL